MQTEKSMASRKKYTLHSLGTFEKDNTYFISTGIRNYKHTNVYIHIQANNTITVPKVQTYNCQT